MFLFFLAVIYWVYVYFQVRGGETPGSFRGGVGPVEEREVKDSVAWQYAGAVQRAGELRDAEHFAEAMELLDQFAERHPNTEWAKYAMEEKRRLRDVASGCYERVRKDVQRYRLLQKAAEAQSLLDHVIRHYGVPELVEEAKKEKERLGEAGTPPGAEPGTTEPKDKPAEPGQPEPKPEAEKPAEPAPTPPAEPKQPLAP
jgi:hypothetical protein